MENSRIIRRLAETSAKGQSRGLASDRAFASKYSVTRLPPLVRLFGGFHGGRLARQLEFWAGREILHVIRQVIGARQGLATDVGLTTRGHDTADKKRSTHDDTKKN